MLLGLTLFNAAAYGTDQDLTQLMLSCKSAARGSWSLILSYLIGWPVLALFMLAGLLLYVYYQRPDLMGAGAPAAPTADSADIFVAWLLDEMPVGLRGPMMAGLFAPALRSLAPALNALAPPSVSALPRPRR